MSPTKLEWHVPDIMDISSDISLQVSWNPEASACEIEENQRSETYNNSTSHILLI